MNYKKNAYSILCEFLDRIMTLDSNFSFLVYKKGTKNYAPFEEYRLRLIYDEQHSRGTRHSDILLLGDHFRKEHEEYIDGYDFAFKSDDLLKVKNIMFMIIERYIWWEYGGDETNRKKSITFEDENYLESLEDLSLTSFEKEVEWIETQIPGKISWKNFQNMRKLDNFVKNKI
jgi:hypothetical protein